MSDQLKAAQLLCVQLAQRILSGDADGKLAREVVAAYDDATRWSDIFHHIENEGDDG